MTEYRRVAVDGSVREVIVQNGTFTWLDGRSLHVDTVIHMPPVTPRIIACVHLNYRSRLQELGRDQPPAPTYFWKPVSCLNAHRGQVIRPPGCQFLNYEGELALVISRTTRNIRPEDAAEHILGYTIANDFGLHDFRDTDENAMARVKGSDTLGPVGPALHTDWDFRDKFLRTYVDGVVVQQGETADMIWDPHYLLADLARSITFERGDLILTGTPANSRPVGPGSTVTVEIQGLGQLTNYVTEALSGVAGTFGAQPSASETVRRVALGGARIARG